MYVLKNIEIHVEIYPMEEIIEDGIKFFKNVGFYKGIYEYDIKGYNKTDKATSTIQEIIEEIAQKYNLYGNEWETEVEYFDKYIIPRLEKFFMENFQIKTKMSDIYEYC